MAVHGHYKSVYISLPSSAQEQCEVTIASFVYFAEHEWASSETNKCTELI